MEKKARREMRRETTEARMRGWAERERGERGEARGRTRPGVSTWTAAKCQKVGVTTRTVAVGQTSVIAQTAALKTTCRKGAG